MMEKHPEIPPWDRNLKVPVLQPNTVYLWMFALNPAGRELEYCASLLSDDERARAAKFFFARARDQFTLVRGALRNILGAYLNVHPGQVEFVYGPHGKPMLKTGADTRPIHFNVSHAEDWGVVAVCLGQPIGVDIESLRALADITDLARQFFTAQESALLESLTGSKKTQLFYKLWTCKEAYLKASGEGLLLPLDQVEVRFAADGNVSLQSNSGLKMPEWSLRLFNPHPEYQVAVCVHGFVDQYFLHIFK